MLTPIIAATTDLSIALLLASLRRLKRVKSFPIVTDDEDVAAVVDQTTKTAKKASKKVAHQLVRVWCMLLGVHVQMASCTNHMV